MGVTTSVPFKATGTVHGMPSAWATLLSPPWPPDLSSLQAYMLTVATCELARASLAPLPAKGEQSPMSVVLAYLQVGEEVWGVAS